MERVNSLSHRTGHLLIFDRAISIYWNRWKISHSLSKKRKSSSKRKLYEPMQYNVNVRQSLMSLLTLIQTKTATFFDLCDKNLYDRFLNWSTEFYALALWMKLRFVIHNILLYLFVNKSFRFQCSPKRWQMLLLIRGCYFDNSYWKLFLQASPISLRSYDLITFKLQIGRYITCINVM